MKATTPALLDLIPNPKAINARATFRVMRPQFSVGAFSNNILVTDNNLVDTCAYGTGILRVTNYNNYLYTHYAPDVHVNTAWVDSGIALVPGSRPGVDGGYVWYQKASSPSELYYRDYGNWSVEVIGRGDGDGQPEILAPIRNERCYSLVIFDDHIRFHMGEAVTIEKFWYERQEYLYGVTQPRLDAVNYSDDADHPVDYVYFTDRDAGRIMEMRVVPSIDSNVVWGQPRPIIAIDAIDEVYGLNLHGAEIIDGKVVVTGRLTRTSDGNPVSMDVYTFGPENFSLGRDMFISSSEVGGKIMVVGTELVKCGARYISFAIGTHLFGVDNEIYKLETSDIGHLQMQEAENRSSTVALSLSPALSHVALVRGAQVEIETAYNDEWIKVLTGEVARVVRTRGEGESLTVEIANLTAKRLSQWSPDQGIYVPSQSHANCRAADLSKIIRADGKFSVALDAITAGKYDDTDSHWVYTGTWGTDTPEGAYNNTIHYNNATDAIENASIDFVGTSFTFTFTKFTDRGIHDIWVDGVLLASVNAYSATKIQGTYTSPALDPGLHTFKVTHGSPISGYIDVDAIEIFGSAEVSDAPLTPAEFNKLSVLYTAARASRGGIMRAKFWNETTSALATRNPRFGVGLNYYRESKVEAAARLSLEYTDVDDEMCGHNGIVAIYSRNEANGNAGIALYHWENSVLTRLTYYAFTLATGNVWMQVRFIEGRVAVHTRTDTETTWTQRINFPFMANNPWFHEDGGHGCVVMEKRLMRSTACYALSSDDNTLAVDSHSSFPTSGTVLVDKELVTYGSKSTVTSPAVNKFEATAYVDRYQIAEGVVNAGAPVRVGAPSGTPTTENAYNGLAAVWRSAAQLLAAGLGMYPDNIPSGRTFRIKKFWDPTQMWNPTDWSSGFISHKGDTSFGSWVTADSLVRVFVFSPDPYIHLGFPRDAGYEEFAGVFIVRPALHLTGRGASDTTAASHSDGLAYEYADIQLTVDEVEFYSQEEDITLAGALRRVLNLAGGSVTERYLIDVTSITGSHPLLGSTWNVLDIEDGKKDFIAEIEISETIPAGQQVRIGIGFYGTIPLSDDFDEGYLLCVEDAALSLYNMEGGPVTLLEKVYPNFGHRLFGVLRVSVQDNRFAVWLNHRLLHVFSRDTYSVEAYQYKGFVIHNPLGAALPPIRFTYSELNDLMADIVVGTRGKGMAILGELTGNRRVYFRSEPDGSLHFYKAMSDIGNLPDIVISEQREQVDELLSRVRVEGIKIAEIADFDALKNVGNLFETVNSMYAETVQDLVADGQKVVELLKQRSNVRSLETVFHPALQPGDVGVINIAGDETEIGVMSTSVTLGFNGENFDVNAGIEVYVT